jgi:hypothetical protein
MPWRRADRLDRPAGYAGPASATIPELEAASADLQAAYERGRKDERRGRKRHPVAMTLMFAAAAVGTVVLVMAAMQGSFAGGGARVDQNLEVAADRAEPIVRDAVANAGQAVQEAGRNVKADGTAPAN